MKSFYFLRNHQASQSEEAPGEAMRQRHPICAAPAGARKGRLPWSVGGRGMNRCAQLWPSPASRCLQAGRNCLSLGRLIGLWQLGCSSNPRRLRQVAATGAGWRSVAASASSRRGSLRSRCTEGARAQRRQRRALIELARELSQAE